MEAGRFKGRGVKGSEQFNMLEGKAPCIALDLKIASKGGEEFMTTFLYFSEAAAPYSYERLRALGWKGQGPADLADLSGIDANEVDVEVVSETYEGKARLKANILTGNSRVTLADKVDPKIFAAKVAAMLGNSGAAPAAAGVKPPF